MRCTELGKMEKVENRKREYSNVQSIRPGLCYASVVM